MSESGVSIIISARNEFPQIAQTITNLMLDLWQSEIHDWEFIIADNGSVDETTSFFKFAWADSYAKKAFTQHRKEKGYRIRGMVAEGRLRFCYDPVFSNVGARHLAVKYARYPNLFFADGHIAVKPGTFKTMLDTLGKYKGIVHAPVAWMGASIYRAMPGMQYSYKIGEKIWGTWNRIVVADTPYYIPLSGHCFFGVNKQEYLEMGGYDTFQQIYGGGENYLDTTYWLCGSTVMVDPRALVFHLSAGRGYAYNQTSLIHNMMLTAYTLGGYKWAERIYITYMNKAGTDKEFLKELYEQAIEEGQVKRKYIAGRQIMNLDQLLGINEEHDCDGHCWKGQTHKMRIWDKMNEELHGKHLSFVAVLDDWLGRLTDPDAIKFYNDSEHQK